MRPAAVAGTGLVALAVAIGIGRFAFTPILPMMQEDAGVSVAAGGWLAAVNYVGYLAGALSIVWLRIGAATAVRAGLVTIGVATLGMGVAAGFAWWVALRAVAGVASAWVLINASAWCLERLAPWRSRLLNGTVFAGVGVGIALAGTICLGLMAVHASSARAWIVLGIVAVALSAGIWRAFGAGGPRAARAAPADLARGAWDPRWTRLVVCYGAFGFGYIIPATFLPVMAKQVIRDPVVFGWSWPVFGAAAALSAVALAVLPPMTNRRAWSAGHLVMAVGIALPVIRPGIVAIMLAALAVGGTFMIITMVGLQEAREAGGPHATRLMAAITAAFGLGQILGPLLVSALAGQRHGMAAALSIASAALAISAYLLLRGGRRPRT
jgi:MFS family permease